MIVVTGATGKLGRHVIRGLEQRVPAAELALLVRNPANVSGLAHGVTVRQGDYGRPETLGAGLRGADKVLLISSSEVGQRAAQHQAVIDAAKQEGVQLLVYTSLLHADRSPLTMLAAEHQQTEAAIRASGIPYVFLRNGWYLENYTEAMSTALKLGAVFGSASGGRISGASRADYAAAAVEVLATPGHAGKTYELAGDRAFTMQDYVRELSHQSGRAIVYNNLPPVAYTQTLLDAGLPPAVAQLLANSDEGIANGGLEDDSGTLSRLIGRPTMTIAEAIAAALPK